MLQIGNGRFVLSDETGRARVLSRKESNGCDDYVVCKHPSGFEFIASLTNTVPSQWVGHVLFGDAPPPCPSTQADTKTGNSLADEGEQSSSSDESVIEAIEKAIGDGEAKCVLSSLIFISFDGHTCVSFI